MALLEETVRSAHRPGSLALFISTGIGRKSTHGRRRPVNRAVLFRGKYQEEDVQTPSPSPALYIALFRWPLKSGYRYRHLGKYMYLPTYLSSGSNEELHPRSSLACTVPPPPLPPFPILVEDSSACPHYCVHETTMLTCEMRESAWHKLNFRRISARVRHLEI